MKLFVKHRRKIAFFLLTLLAAEVIPPRSALALTSGPSQPEMKGFEPAGTTDMVDLFTGDFSYNIPLLDVGGYPVNLAYHSGSGIEDEASWVGFGWSLTPGSINRQVRGLPDDFNGRGEDGNYGDSVTRMMARKPEIRAGLAGRAKLELLGIPLHKNKLTVSTEIYNDNYWGIGAVIGANAGLSLSHAGSGSLTASLGLSSDSHSGVDITPALNFSIGSSATDRLETHPGLSIGFPYNSRAGLRTMTLGLSFSALQSKFSYSTESTISFAGEAYTPQITMPTKTTSFTASVDLGPTYAGAFGTPFGLTGDYFKEGLATAVVKQPAYGYLNEGIGKDDPVALMDMNREKDGPYVKEDPYLPVPINTFDLYTVTNQDGVSQFRPMQGSSGVLFDPKQSSTSSGNSVGLEVGWGGIIEGGADVYNQSLTSSSFKWTSHNDVLPAMDFTTYDPLHPDFEPVYFKQSGDQAPADSTYTDLLRGPRALRVSVARAGDDAQAQTQWLDRSGDAYSIGSPLKRAVRDKRNSTLSFLTAAEAETYGLDTAIYSYPYNQLLVGACTTPPTAISRVSDSHKPHHISQITQTDVSGRRYIYGIPVYNLKQNEVSFSVNAGTAANQASGQVAYTASGFNPDNSLNNSKGRSHYYTKQEVPAYATSYLLTAILSPDYVDKTGNGVTDDDPGVTTKFNYTKTSGAYKWRSPYGRQADIASYEPGMLSDLKDDQGSYVYGEKELWYLHSIESKTMVAQFILEDREDALGVTDENGAKSATPRQKLLKEIRLYSKSDLANAGSLNQAAPIKTVHFEYDYSICRGVPNAGTGKLTLKRVYFTFGANNKGKLHPYVFAYNDADTTSATNVYELQAYDRWGTFKDSASNLNGLLNSEYPYTLQDSVSASTNAAKWQLSRIDLPTGGSIQVTYESDDYAYVQNKRAMQMFLIKDVAGSTSGTGLINAPYVEVAVPEGVSDIGQLTEGIDYLYFKCLVNLDATHQEYVPGYAKVKQFELSSDKKTLKIYFDMSSGASNPIAKAAWQFFRTNLPQYVYPGYENLSPDESNFEKAIMALKNAVLNLREIVQDFNDRARQKRYANQLVPGKSWVRLCSPSYKKMGGGARVKSIVMSDDWQHMSGATGAISAAYGQQYTYTTTIQGTDGAAREISSGVAAYEPMLGGDENPFRQPVFYNQKIPLSLTNYYYKELPMCESYYPAPLVGYSRVTVTNIGADGIKGKTGYTVDEFYTAKDFPTQVEITPLKLTKTASSSILGLLKAEVKDGVGVSQGYAVTLNNMHGKPKSVSIYDAGGGAISAVRYAYNTQNALAETQQLNNEVSLLHPDGTVGSGAIGESIDLVTDMRAQQTDNIGKKVQGSGGVSVFGIFVFGFGFFHAGVNNEHKSYNSATTVKVIHQFGVLKKVTKMQNGSTITTQNELWDGETGNVLLTKTQNEFDDPVYNFTYPAYWAYPGMGPAYRHEGMYIQDFYSDVYGNIYVNGSSTTAATYLSPGDEIADLSDNVKGWVARNAIGNLILMDRTGSLISMNSTVKIIRSGERNMAGSPIGTIVCLSNPIVNNQLDISASSEVLDAKSVTYDEAWPIPVPCNFCSAGFSLSADGTYCYKDVTATQEDTAMVCLHPNDAYSKSGSYVYDPGYCVDGVSSFSRHRFAEWNPFWVGVNECCAVDTLQTGDCGIATLLPQMSSQNTVAKDTSSEGLLEAMGIQPQASLEPQGPLNRCGIWVCGDEGAAPYVNTWIGVSGLVDFPESKVYYVGIAGDNEFRAMVDNNYIINNTDEDNVENFWVWHIYPYYITQGTHLITIEGLNSQLNTAASFGMEIYNNTLAQMDTAHATEQLNILFSTHDFVNSQFTTNYSCPSGSTLVFADGSAACRYTEPHNLYVNPYVEGLLGDWRVKRQYVYQVNRTPYDTSLTNSIRKAGYYTAFNPFWVYDAASTQRFITDTASWTWSSEITHYNQKGVETEERDALGRYSAALFGYNESAPVLVAANAREGEVLFDGFEDYGFNSSCEGVCRPEAYVKLSQLADRPQGDTIRGISHTGNYSLKLTGSDSLTAAFAGASPDEGTLYTFDTYGRLVPSATRMLRGFSPVAGKKYLISLWVKDGTNAPTTAFQLKQNSASLLESSAHYPVVEGWKKIETTFTATDGGDGVCRLIFDGGGTTVYLDDIRVLPFDAEAKSFVYDARSQRLMAQLDENNFATLYEYDDEGILIRLKKETEKGIVTVKETRSSYKMHGQ